MKKFSKLTYEKGPVCLVHNKYKGIHSKGGLIRGLRVKVNALEKCTRAIDTKC